MNEQAVIENSEEEPKVSSEETDAQEPDLDSLLKEYETSEPKEAQQEVQPNEDITWLREQRAQYEREQTEKAVSEAAGMLRGSLGDLPINIPDYMLEGVLHQRASKDPRIIYAFNKRFSNPTGWESIVKATGKQVAKDLTPKDQKATDSWKEVESAVHSASTSTPGKNEAPDLSHMTDAEFMAYKNKLLGR